MSKLHDLTAAALYGTYEDVDIVITHAFFPITAAHQKANDDGIPLFGWEQDGWLTMSNTPTVSYDDIVNWFVSMRDMGFKIQRVGFDKKFGREFFSGMKKAKFKIVDAPQYLKNRKDSRRIETYHSTVNFTIATLTHMSIVSEMSVGLKRSMRHDPV